MYIDTNLEFSDAQAITATVPAPGVYPFRVLIRDAQGLSLTGDASVEVVFPAPLGPRSPKIEPRGTARSTPLSACLAGIFLDAAYVLVSPVTSMARSGRSTR